MKKLYKVISFLAISILFSSSTFSTPINQFINSVSPTLNANSVVKSSDIVITFEQVMNGSTMTAANVKVFGYQTGLMTVSLDFNSVANTLTINTMDEFKNGEKISVTLTSGIKTISNQSISSFVYSFRTKALGGTAFFTKTSGIFSTADYILSGDVDGDSDLDLLINDKIYKNNGNAVFTLYSTLSLSGIPVMADFDNDGDLDIQSTLNNVTYLFKNNGDGNFIQTTSYPGLNGSIGDLNGDGFFDMVYVSQQTGNEVIIIKNSNGHSAIDTVYQISNNCNSVTNYSDRVMIDDFNNDGSLDLIGINGVRSGGGITGFDLCRSFHKFNNNGIGKFSTQFFYNKHSSSTSSFILFLKDSKSFDNNNDGYIDVISSEVILNNPGNGSLIFNGSFSSFWNSMDADFNGDNYIDFFVNIRGSSIIQYINNGDGSFSQNIQNNLSYDASSAFGDYDNDGDIDIAIKEYNTGEIAILLNGDSPLPVELSSFTSSINLNSVKLNWTTSQEQNNSGFEIQRTENSNEVQEVWKKVDFINGTGNSSTEKNYSYDDKDLASGKYKYRLKQIDFNGNFEYHELSNEVVIGIPKTSELLQNYPNPFNPVTYISYRLSENGFVTLRIFDNSGREVKTLVNEFKQAGYYTDIFNGSDLASGVYFYKLSFGDFVQTKKLSLVK
ncbi:MAG: FG-GAP-like repeat-containing protein [Ignavibacteria bacterium]